MSSTIVRLFTRAGCSLCEPVKFIITKTNRRYPFRYEEIDIAAAEHSKTWLPLYTNDIPVVHVNGAEIARHGLKEAQLTAQLEAAGCKPNKA